MRKPYRTRQAPTSAGSMVKPGELIDFVEMTPLSLIDRRTYNLLLAHAWDRIDQPVAHVIAKSELLGWSNHESTDIIGESVERLMAAIIRTQVEIDGKPYIQRTQLLASTTEARAPDGLLYYRFSDEMRAIIRDSGIFARLHTDVILALSSRYSLALYELCRKRVNLGQKWSEEFTVDRFRELLGVEPGVLPAFKSFNQRAVLPAVAEVNGLSEVACKIEPVLAGRKVVKIRLSWWRKNEDELKDAYRELQTSKVGRRARLKGTVENVAPGIEPESLPAITPRPTACDPAPEPTTQPVPSLTGEMSEGQFVVAFWKYLMDAESPQDLLDRMITLSAHHLDLTGPGGFALPDGTHVRTSPAPDLTARQSPELQAKLQQAFDHWQSLAAQIKAGRAHPSWYTPPRDDGALADRQ